MTYELPKLVKQEYFRNISKQVQSKPINVNLVFNVLLLVFFIILLIFFVINCKSGIFRVSEPEAFNF